MVGVKRKKYIAIKLFVVQNVFFCSIGDTISARLKKTPFIHHVNRSGSDVDSSLWDSFPVLVPLGEGQPAVQWARGRSSRLCSLQPAASVSGATFSTLYCIKNTSVLCFIHFKHKVLAK